MKDIKLPGWVQWMSALGTLVVLGSFTACVQVKTEPIRIEPIYIEITVNHRVQKELDALFEDIDKASETADFVPINDSELNQ